MAPKNESKTYQGDSEILLRVDPWTCSRVDGDQPVRVTDDPRGVMGVTPDEGT